jgi:NAD(P)H dehydrogenase (quinone)
MALKRIATGPAIVTGAERAALMSEITGKPLRFITLDEAQLRSGFSQAGVPQEYVNSLVDIERHFMAGDFDIVTGDVQRFAGRSRFAKFCQDNSPRRC